MNNYTFDVGLQMADVELDARVTSLEESISGQNGNLEIMKVMSLFSDSQP